MKDSHPENRSLCVDEIFERHARLTPDRIAISTGAGLLTYGELNERAEVLASRLAGLGVGPDTRVGICLDRGADMIVSILGVLKAGAAYVPLDPGYPPDRLEFMIADASLSALISDGAMVTGSAVQSVPTIRVVAGWLEGRAGVEKCARQGADAPVYLMYTSGSTGKPKGVVVPHRGVTRLVCSPDYLDIRADDVFLQLAPVSFDASTLEIWGALLNGARLAIMPPGPASLGDIGEVIHREGVTILWLTGGLFNLIVDERVNDLRPVKQLLVGGEVLSVAHVERALAALPNTQLINGYGPTENTTFTCCHRIRAGEGFPRGVPIGRPIRGTTVRVVNEQLREVGPGQEGELLAGGDGVALGYWNRPDLTAERFVSDPSSPPGVPHFYRTGDHVRVRDDGVIEFLGRRDDQVKLRGFRIEMGEIEAAIRAHKGVRDCVVKVATHPAGQGYLVAYVVRNSGMMAEEKELLDHLAHRLPDHMWPGVWVFLDQLPLNPNGKVDRAALPEPLSPIKDAGDERPTSELECVIGDTWREILGGRPIGLSVSFFDAGGNSLQVTRLHELLGRKHGIILPLTDLFRFPSVRGLAMHLNAERQPAAPAVAPGQGLRGAAQRGALSRFRKPPANVI